MRRTYRIYNHQNKGARIVEALNAAGWQQVEGSHEARVIFSDVDAPARRVKLEMQAARGKKIFLFPHAARPNVFNDFEGYPPFDRALAQFVTAAGHIEIMQRIGVPHRMEVIGWMYCPIKPFRPRRSHRRVLFAPIHPNNNGTIADVDRDLNIRAFRKLLCLVDAGEIDLTVRYLRGLEKNGLWWDDRVTYVEGHPDQSYEQIDRADAVVAHQTYAYISVARGTPTVMFGEDVPPRLGSEEMGNFQFVQHFDRYRDMLMYHLDILAEEDTSALLRRAVKSDQEIIAWRERMIGRPFDPDHFIRTVERYVLP